MSANDPAPQQFRKGGAGRTFDETLLDAARFIITHTDEPCPTEKLNEYLSAVEAAELRAWYQSWGTTAGPFEGFGGAAITTWRITAVRLGNLVVWYLDDICAFTTSLDDQTVADHWTMSRMPNFAMVRHAIPDWAR